MESGCRVVMESVTTSFSVVCKSNQKKAKPVAEPEKPQMDSEEKVALDGESEPMDELARAKQAIKAWQNKANSLQKRNELLETEIIVLKTEKTELLQQLHPMANGEASGEPDGEGEAEDVKDEADKGTGDEGEDEEYDTEEEEEEEMSPRTRAEMEQELENTKDQLEEMTQLYEDLLQQRNKEMRLRKYGTVDNQSYKAKVTELQVQIDQLKVKHREELTKKKDELKIVEERSDRDRSKVSTLRKELESIKTENTNLMLEKKRLERSLQKVYSAKQKRREQAEDSIKEIEVSTLRLKNNRLQMELQKTQTSPPQSMYSSQESLLETGKPGSLIDGIDHSAFPPSTESRERELETEIESLKEEVQSLNTRLAEESDKNKTMVEHWEKQLAFSLEKVAALQTKLEKADTEVEMLTHELELAETTVDELTIKLEETEAELAEKLKLREDELNEINEALEDAQGQLRNVPSDTVLLQQKLLELQQELEDTRNMLAETKKQLDKEIIAVSWKNQELTQLRNKLQE